MFPSHDRKGQAKELGIKFISGKEFNYKKYCTECVEGGKAEFKCFHCKEIKNSGLIQESIGASDCADHICKDCYETLTAKEWDSIIEEMEEDHKYDHC